MGTERKKTKNDDGDRVVKRNERFGDRVVKSKEK